MPAPTICTVSGTCRQVSGAVLGGVVVTAYTTRPFVHPTDSSLVCDYLVSTTSASDGTWSLALIETATPAVTLSISFTFSLGSTAPNDYKVYAITVPNQASATFSSLIGSQI